MAVNIKITACNQVILLIFVNSVNRCALIFKDYKGNR